MIGRLVLAILLLRTLAGADTPGSGLLTQVLSPIALAATGEGSTLYVACGEANCVLAVNTESGRVMRALALPGSPSGLALSTDARRLDITCPTPQSMVCVLDTGVCPGHGQGQTDQAIESWAHLDGAGPQP